MKQIIKICELLSNISPVLPHAIQSANSITTTTVKLIF